MLVAEPAPDEESVSTRTTDDARGPGDGRGGEESDELPQRAHCTVNRAQGGSLPRAGFLSLDTSICFFYQPCSSRSWWIIAPGILFLLLVLVTLVVSGCMRWSKAQSFC